MFEVDAFEQSGGTLSKSHYQITMQEFFLFAKIVTQIPIFIGMTFCYHLSIFEKIFLIKIPAMNKASIFDSIMNQRNAIKKFGVKQLGLFGSYVRNEANSSSDVDLLVEFEEGKKSYNNFISLAFYLEELLGKRVELLTTQSLSPYLKSQILKEVEYVAI